MFYAAGHEMAPCYHPDPSLSFRYDIGIIDQVLAMSSFRVWSGTRPIDANAPDITGWIVSTFLFGCIGGSCCVSFLADAIGRKRSSEIPPRQRPIPPSIPPVPTFLLAMQSCLEPYVFVREELAKRAHRP